MPVLQDFFRNREILHAYIAEPSRDIIDNYHSHGIVPYCLKIARICLVFKQDNKAKVIN